MQAGLAAAMALLGLASGVHCVGMCGGIVTAFSAVPLRFSHRKESLLAGQLAFNAGRISTYAAAGALAGAVGYAAGAHPAQGALYVLVNVVLILAGLHLAGQGRWLALERLGVPLWKRLQPLAARVSATGNPYLAGLLWGWLPCGLVYAALAAAAFSGSAFEAAGAMAAFGLGTLPWLLATGLVAARLRAAARGGALRIAAGGALATYGLFGLF